MEYKVKVLIVDNQVRCASQVCNRSCPNHHLCVDAVLTREEEHGKDSLGENK